MTRRWIPGAFGVGLLLAALLMPVDWYAALPFREDLAPPPVPGVTLLRLALALLGAILLAASALGWTYVRRSDARAEPDRADGGPTDARVAMRALVAITLLSLALRLYRISSDLWLDEISALVTFGRGSVLEILGVFTRSGNHLLNTLLVKLSVGLFGETEWAARLPAVLFGVATVPALYWVARLALPRRESLASALLLAVSYHHIFFSQNARGYAAYMFFSVASTGFLVRALDDDRARNWFGLIATSVLNLASQLLSAFVIAGQFVTGALEAVIAGRRTATVGPRIRRLLSVFITIGLLGFTTYALVLVQAYAGLSAPYRTLTSGVKPLGIEFIADIFRGLADGFGPAVLVGAIPFLAIGALGFVVIARRRATLAIAFAAPPVLTLTVFIARQMTIRPRFLLFAVPVAMVCFVQGLSTAVELATRWFRWSARVAEPLKWSGVAALAGVSLLALVPYYGTPKQSYRATIAYIDAERRAGDRVILFGNTEVGFRFYGGRAGWDGAEEFVYVREPMVVDSIVRAQTSGAVYLVFTLARDIRLSQPEFAERLQREWTRLRVFPGTVGDGNITVLRHGPAR